MDFNEEYSALYGGYLDDQTSYLAHCITSILNLYAKSPNRPEQVVVVAHSMVFIFYNNLKRISNLI